MNRDLDGVYFRVKTEDGWDDVCFSDLTEAQQDEMMKNRNEEWLKELCKHLARVLKTIGDEFNIVTDRVYEELIDEEEGGIYEGKN